MPQPIVTVGPLPRQRWEQARLLAIILTMRLSPPKPQALNGRRGEPRPPGEGDADAGAPGRSSRHGLALIEEDFGAEALAQGIPTRGLELTAFLCIAIQLAAGLEAIHRSGVTHRQVHPHNRQWRICIWTTWTTPVNVSRP